MKMLPQEVDGLNSRTEHPMANRVFSAFYSEDEWNVLQALEASKPQGAGLHLKAWLSQRGLLEEGLHLALAKFILRKSQAGELQLVSFAKGRGHVPAAFWDRMVNLAPADADVATKDAMFFARGLLAAIRRSLPPKADHAMLCAMAEAGNAQWVDMCSASECDRTGELLYLQLECWQAKLGAVDATTGEFEPLQAEATQPMKDRRPRQRG